MEWNKIANLILALIAGTGLGIIFFGGLWYTVRIGLRSKHTALIFTTSLIIRMALVLIGFYYIGANNWQMMLASVSGFIIARYVITRFTQKETVTNSTPINE